MKLCLHHSMWKIVSNQTKNRTASMQTFYFTNNELLNSKHKYCIKMNHPRKVHTSAVRCLQLANEQTIEDWNKEFFMEYGRTKVAIKQRGIAYHPTKMLGSVREFYYVLVKDGSNFTLPSEPEEVASCFSHPDVLATTHIRRSFRKIPWIIQNRYNTVNEWEEKIQKIIDIGSFNTTRNLMLTSTMGFVLLNDPQFTKVDESLDPADSHLRGPLVQSFIDYLLNEEINLPHCQRSLIIYMKQCLTSSNIDLLEKAYEKARNKIKVFGLDFMDVSTYILAHTKYAKDLVEFFKIQRTIYNKPHFNETVEVELALRSGELEKGLSLLGNIFNIFGKTSRNYGVQRVIPSLLDAFRYDEDPAIWKRNKEVVETFLTQLANFQAFPRNEEHADAIGNWFTSIQDEKWEYALIHNNMIQNRKCPFTNVYLDEKKLTDEEYDYLRKVIVKSVIKAGYKLELRSFFSTVYDNGPFEVVIDGLNLFYLLRMKMNNVPSLHQSYQLTSAWLRNFIQARENVIGRKLKVLVVTRSHMKKFSKLCDDFATTWHAPNDSEDDPYFLYAALISGRNCKLLTLDHLRDVHYKIKKEYDYMTVNLIYKWQQLHQDLVILRNSQNMRRQEFDVSIQRTPTTWHIPYYDHNDEGPMPNNWLCLKKVS